MGYCITSVRTERTHREAGDVEESDNEHDQRLTTAIALVFPLIRVLIVLET